MNVDVSKVERNLVDVISCHAINLIGSIDPEEEIILIGASPLITGSVVIGIRDGIGRHGCFLRQVIEVYPIIAVRLYVFIKLTARKIFYA